MTMAAQGVVARAGRGIAAGPAVRGSGRLAECRRPRALARRAHPLRRGCTLRAQAVKEHTGGFNAKNLRIGLVVARFNEIITRPLLSGALEALSRHGASDDNVEVAWVPGAFEIPLVAQQMAASDRFDAIVCIGAVIRGDTTHYDSVTSAATNGTLTAGMNTGVPCIFGVLTTDTLEQAFNRAGGKAGNKGAEAALTAVETANLLKTMPGATWGTSMELPADVIAAQE